MKAEKHLKLLMTYLKLESLQHKREQTFGSVQQTTQET